MKSTSIEMIDLFFNPQETFCVSPDQYAYHSINRDILQNYNFSLISSNPSCEPISTTEDDIELIAINPISGFRNDSTVTAFRSFLIEIDFGSLEEQKQYIDSLGLPYSVCVFSGNKSLHYGIVLDEDLPDINTWRILCQWLLNIVQKADQSTKNPSRCIRFPETLRTTGKKLKQKLIEIKGRVNCQDLYEFLNKFQECKPKPVIQKPRNLNRDSLSFEIPNYMREWLDVGVETLTQRNNKWFIIASAYSERGFEIEETIQELLPYFTEEPDFNIKEWMSTVSSAYKFINRRN